MCPDGNGYKRVIHLEHPPRRIVSLVPSLTESLFELGLGVVVVGITDYCVYPEKDVEDLPRIGGPKNPRLNEILELEPDLVLANQEENTSQDVDALEEAGISVWVTFPKTVRQALDVLWVLVGVFMSRVAAIRLETLELTVEWAEAAIAERRSWRYFCPIWQDRTSLGQQWWMTFNRDTYTHDLLRLMGGHNVFAERERRYPLEADLGLAPDVDPEGRDVRYPRVSQDEVLASNPELIVLPSEPYPYGESQHEEILHIFAGTQAVKLGQVYLVEGSLLTWHGTRLARALRELPNIFPIAT